MTEADHFIIELALSIGFDPIDDDATRFRCSQEQIVEIVTRARKQGRDDVARIWELLGVDNETAAIARLEELLAPLSCAGGAFQCTPDHAVQAAYILSCAEACIARDPLAASEVGPVLVQYVDGTLSADEVVAELLGEEEPK